MAEMGAMERMGETGRGAGGCPIHAHGTADGGGDAPLLDILDPTFDPLGPGVSRAQGDTWYARTPLGVAALRYEEVAALLKDRRLRQGAVAHLAFQGITEGPLAE